jgi:hypothetical protein
MEFAYTEIARHKFKYLPSVTREKIECALHAAVSKKEWALSHIEKVEAQGEGAWYALWYPDHLVCFFRKVRCDWEVTSIEEAAEYRAWEGTQEVKEN